jgi:hypothetical protein
VEGSFLPRWGGARLICGAGNCKRLVGKPSFAGTAWNPSSLRWALLMRPDDSVDISLRRGARRRAATLRALCILTAGAVSGCSTNDGIGSFIIDPGHYSVYHCKDLATRLQALLAREKDLSNLMDKASEGSGGLVIANLSYRADYENAVGEEKVLRRTAAEKKCELPPPSVPVAPTPAVYSTPPTSSPPVYSAPPPAAAGPVFQSDQTIR